MSSRSGKIRVVARKGSLESTRKTTAATEKRAACVQSSDEMWVREMSLVVDVECGRSPLPTLEGERNMKCIKNKINQSNKERESKSFIIHFLVSSLCFMNCVSIFLFSLFMIPSLLVVFGHVHSLAPSRG